MENNEIKIEGDCFEDFEKTEPITEIILIGKFGGIKRILLTDINRIII